MEDTTTMMMMMVMSQLSLQSQTEMGGKEGRREGGVELMRARVTIHAISSCC
jgi:hypothetical protein